MNYQDETHSVAREDVLASTSIDFHGETETYRAEFDHHTRPVSEAVVTAVSEASGKDALELPPLYSVIDPDALDDVFAPRAPSRASPDRRTLSFDFGGHRVTVHGYGVVEVEASRDD